MPKSQEIDTPAAEPTSDGGSSALAFFFLLGAVIVVAYIAIILTRHVEPMGLNHPAVGKQLTAFAVSPLDDASGPGVSVEELKGKVALIDFWGPWCPPCREEMPHLIALAKARKDKPFRLVLVTCWGKAGGDDEELAKNGREFIDKYTREMPLYSDIGAANRLALLKTTGIDEFHYPTTVLLDREGIIRGLWVGFDADNHQEEEMAAAVDRLLAR